MSFKIKYIYKVNFQLIFNFMKENKLAVPDFCEKCKISYAEFGDLLREYEYIDSHVFYKVSEYIRVDVNSLIIRLL